MKKLLFGLAAMFSFLSCSKTIEAEGPVTAEEVIVPASANIISVKSAMELLLSDEVAEGEVVIKTNDDIHKYIDVVKSDNQVLIQLDKNSYKNLKIQILASAKQFNSIYASGASQVTVDDEALAFDEYSFSLSGASRVSVETPLVVKECSISASGASSVSGGNFTTDRLTLDLSGASSVKMGVNSSITGELSGASSVKYWGDATVSVESSGASEVKKIK